MVFEQKCVNLPLNIEYGKIFDTSFAKQLNDNNDEL